MKLSDVSIERPVFAIVMSGVLLVFGLYAYKDVGVDLMPDVEFPFVTVTAVYPGADPATIESKVVDKLEEQISTVSGIKMMRSTSMENVGLVFIQFELERKADQAVQDVRDKVNAALRNLPKDIEPPVVQKFDIGAIPVIQLAVSGGKDIAELTRVADKRIKERIQAINGVGSVDIVGGQKREITVWVDPQRLDGYGLAVGDVVQALGMQNVEIPGGRMTVGAREFSIKTRGQLHTAREIGDIVVTSAMGAPVRVSDVARVEDGVEELRTLADLNGRRAVGLVVQKQSGSNTVQVAHKVRDALEQIKKDLPAGFTIAMPQDNSVYIENAIGDVRFDLAFGAILAILIILFFLLDWRPTFISALALPTSVIATFAFIKMMGFTFNQMTMLALSLSIGILIDDAIVVIENIHRHLELGESPMDAAKNATAEIGLAVMATTASILAVFVPVATMKGIVGRFFLQFGLTVAFAVTVSLFVAFTLTPALSARLLHKGRSRSRVAGRIEALLESIEHRYRAVIVWALGHRALTAIAAVVIFAGSLGFLALIPNEFVPPEDRGMVQVQVELPTGSSIVATRAVMDEVGAVIRKVPGFTTTFYTIGAGAMGEVNQGTLVANLVPHEKRAFNTEQAIIHVRALLGGRVDALYAVGPVDDSGGMRGATLQLNLRGADFEALNASAQRVIAQMRQSKGFVDLDTSYRGGKPEVAVNIDRNRAADLNVPVAMIAMTMRTFFAGEKAGDLTADGDRIDVRVRLPEQARRGPADLEALSVRSVTGPLVRLSSLAAAGVSAGPAKIERQDRQRQVTVFSNLSGKALGDALKEVEAMAKTALAPGVTYKWAGMGDIMRESYGHMLAALVLAIVMVYLILAAQFESFVHPFTIMLSLPLSSVGALGALVVSRMTINIFTLIGVILLMGLVTKNAILLVDYTNTLRSRGKRRHEALVEAGAVRLRPILMTTAAMVFGMVPVALALGEGGTQRSPMAVAVIGGLIASTMLTLVVIPVVYDLIEAAQDRIFKRGESRAAASAENA